MSLTDAELISGIREGSEKAFEALFRTYYNRLCHYAHSLLKDLDESEEMVQTVFLNIWEKREDLEITLSLKSYLYRAVHNYCLNRIKHFNVREVHKDYSVYYQSESVDSLNELMHGDELAVQIEKAVQKLPGQCQVIFRMSRFDELKYQEIADHLNISIKTVENQIGKALKILRTELTDYLPLLAGLIFVGEVLKILFH